MKSTKKALFMSCLSLLLCVSMLVGTTFAWFTDSVTSGVNQIVAGNLDIELEFFNGSEWATVTESTKLFNDSSLWEPGHTEVAYLKMSNVGTLALKYQMAINVVSEVEGTNKAGETFKLSDYIKMGVLDSTAVPDTTADRAAVRASIATAGNISAYSKVGNMLPGDDSVYFTVAAFMPEEVDNVANYMTGTTPPQINMGLKLVATQMVNENDSFGPDYDGTAEFEGGAIVIGPSETTAEVTKNAENKVTEPIVITNAEKTLKVTLPVDTLLTEDATNVEVKIEPIAPSSSVVAQAAGKDVASYEITVVGLSEDNTMPIPVELYVGKGLVKVKLYHEGVEVTPVAYEDGFVKFTTTSFSPFDVTYVDPAKPWDGSVDTSWYNTTDNNFEIFSAAELAGLAKLVNEGKSFGRKTVTLAADINLGNRAWTPIGNVTSYPSITFGGTFDGGNHTISNLNASDKLVNHASAGLFGSITGAVKNVTLKNVNITSTHYAGAICGFSSSNGCLIENCHVIGGTITSTPELIGSEYDNGDKVGGIIGYIVGGDKVIGCSVEGLTITAYRDLGGIVGCLTGENAVVNCSVKDTTVIQDNTNGYKSSVTTYGAIFGRIASGTFDAAANGNTETNVTVTTK